MHTTKEAVLPTHSDAQTLTDQFANFFDNKMAKIREEVSEIQVIMESSEGEPSCLEAFEHITEEDIR